MPDNFQIDNMREPGTPLAVKRKILLVTYHFPPSPAVGGIRPAKFAKYLPEFGWTPVVLTIRGEKVKYPDHRRLEELNGTRIVRSAVWPNLVQILNYFRGSTKEGRERKEEYGKVPPDTSTRGFFPDGILKRKGLRLKKFMKSMFELPDQQIGWLLPAVAKGYGLLRRERFDLIYATAPPETGVLVGYALSKISDVNLLVDFRDPCFSHNQKLIDHADPFSYSIEQRLGAKVIGGAGRIITTTKEYRDLLFHYYPGLDRNKVVAIHNGFDLEDLGTVQTSRDPNRFTIAYVGSFYLGRDPEEFLAALRELIDESVIRKEEIEVYFAGSVSKAEGKSVEEMVSQFDLKDSVIVDGMIPYSEAIARIQSSDVLLLLAPDQYHCIPAKAYEYLGVRKPILCIAMEGATANLIRKTQSGIVAHPYHREEIKDAIRKLFMEWKEKGDLKTNVDSHIYERRTTAKILATHLDGLIAR